MRGTLELHGGTAVASPVICVAKRVVSRSAGNGETPGADGVALPGGGALFAESSAAAADGGVAGRSAFSRQAANIITLIKATRLITTPPRWMDSGLLLLQYGTVRHPHTPRPELQSGDSLGGVPKED
jgi:hypothetical protein